MTETWPLSLDPHLRTYLPYLSLIQPPVPSCFRYLPPYIAGTTPPTDRLKRTQRSVSKRANAIKVLESTSTSMTEPTTIPLFHFHSPMIHRLRLYLYSSVISRVSTPSRPLAPSKYASRRTRNPLSRLEAYQCKKNSNWAKHNTSKSP